MKRVTGRPAPRVKENDSEICKEELRVRDVADQVSLYQCHIIGYCSMMTWS